mgnify:CR=1 FL=1|tara:strand:- start:10027 stop:10275 length:249 start_codon:yes stop_codon:yes gene_type:complete
MNKDRITIETTTGITTIEVGSICAYTLENAGLSVTIHLRSGTIFETSEVRKFRLACKASSIDGYRGTYTHATFMEDKHSNKK